MILITAVLMTSCINDHQTDDQIETTSKIEKVSLEGSDHKQQQEITHQDEKGSEDEKKEQHKSEEVSSLVDGDNDQSKEEDLLWEYISKMSLNEKVGQLFMVAVRRDGEEDTALVFNDEMEAYITQYHVGGMILFSENIADKQQVKTLTSKMQQAAKIPLFIGVDEEGGVVSRVGKVAAINDKPFKEAYAIGETGDEQLAYEEAKRMGTLLCELGFNMDFAPVADIYNEKGNTVIGTRSFGCDSNSVTKMVIAFAKGLKEQGILPVIKHFPGHGNTMEDSHTGMAYVNKSLEELQKEELVPFFTALQNGDYGVMKGHLLVSSVDAKYPASLSEVWQEYLAGQIDVKKTLFVTDALNMGAITHQYSSSEAAVLAIKAGNDMLLMPEQFMQAYNGVLIALADGTLIEAQIDLSVYKILSKKIAQNLDVLS